MSEIISDTLDVLRGCVSEAQRHATYAAEMLHDLRVRRAQHQHHGNLTDDDLREAIDTAVEAIGPLAALDRGLGEATSLARSEPTCD